MNEVRIKKWKTNYYSKEFELTLPQDPTKLIDVENEDAIIPYWADEWPSAEVALHILPTLIKNRDTTILEMGAGSGTVSVRLNSIFQNYVATDYSIDGCSLIQYNNQKNGGTLQVLAFDWNYSPLTMKVPVIVGIDILYEEQMIDTVLSFITTHLDNKGKAYIFDPQRPFWDIFKKKTEKYGLKIINSIIQKSSNGADIEVVTIGRVNNEI